MKAESEPLTGSAVGENVAAIKQWDEALLEKRSHAQRLSDRITTLASSGASLVAHAVWFLMWIAVNTGWLPIVDSFDPFPFFFLTTIVAIEAIFLAMFVLASQNRLAKQSELRANLNLQIDLLVEREMTAVLQLLKDITHHLDIHTTVGKEHLAELIEKTDIQELAGHVDPDPERSKSIDPSSA